MCCFCYLDDVFDNVCVSLASLCFDQLFLERGNDPYQFGLVHSQSVVNAVSYAAHGGNA